MNFTSQKSNMVLSGLELNAILGWPEEERRKHQPIVIDVHIEFYSLPKACVNDSLLDTICYDNLVTLIKNLVAKKSFKLLEHLTHEIYQHIKSIVNASAKINVRVKKIPPIPELTGGAAFSISD